MRYLTGVSGGMGIGLLLVLCFPFLQPVYCPDHGKVPLDEFSDADRSAMRRQTAIRLAVTIVLLGLAVAAIAVALRS
jgi:hypothetical protein